MTKKEQLIINEFKEGASVFSISCHFCYGEISEPDIEAILRKALKAQDKKKGKA